MATHYEVLGVAPDASPAALRAAYLAKARELHPDHQLGLSRADLERAQRAMQDVNAAWAVLNDPRSRREYDHVVAAQAEGSRSVFDAEPTAMRMRPPAVVLDELDDEPAPAWTHLVRIGPVVFLLGVLGAIFVVTAFAAGGRYVDLPSNNNVAPGTPEVGSCIDVGRENVPIACDDPIAVRVERRAPAGDKCAGGTVPVKWDDETVLCVRPLS